MLCVTNATPTTDIENGPSTLTEPTANFTGAPVDLAAAVVQACSPLVKTVPSSWTGTPKPPSRHGSAPSVRHDSLLTTHPPSHAATPLVPSTSTTVSALSVDWRVLQPVQIYCLGLVKNQVPL